MFGRLRTFSTLALRTQSILDESYTSVRGTKYLIHDLRGQRSNANSGIPAFLEQDRSSSALQPHRGFASTPALLAASSTNAGQQSGHPHATYPKKDPQEVDAAPLNAPEGAGVIFGGMAVVHAGHAFVNLMDPHKMATYTFAAVAAGPVGDLYSPLHRLMGAGHLAAATTFMALRFGSEQRELDQHWAKRLNLGLAAASAGMLAAHASHLSALTPLAAVSGSLTMGITLATGLYYYRQYSGHGLKPGPMLKEGFQADMGKLLLNVRKPASAVYSMLTIAYLGAGAAYLALPCETLSLIFHMSPSASRGAMADWAFLWRCTGAALLTLPTWTYSLKEAHDQDKLGKPQFKTLNLGLVAAGAAHFMAVYPFMTNNEYGPLFPVIMGTWAVATAVGALGLFKRGVGAHGRAPNAHA